MTIIASASVPSYLNLRVADTAAFPVVRPLAERVDELVGVGLGVVQIAAHLGVTPYAAFKAGVRIRTQDDVTAVAATMAPETETDRARLDAFGAAIVATPLADLAGRYDLSLTTAERVRALFGLADMAEQTAACR